MKRAVILHGTGADHTQNWFPWLKTALEERDYKVWVPDLPNADRPNPKNYNPFLLSRKWDFQDNLIIGHSSGAVEILSLLSDLPEKTTINSAILVGAFTNRLAKDPSWEMLTELFYKPFDFEKIKQKANNFVFVHSLDDPYCPIEDAKELCKKLDGEFFQFEGMGHFSASLDPKFKEFPELLTIIDEKVK